MHHGLGLGVKNFEVLSATDCPKMLDSLMITKLKNEKYVFLMKKT